MLEGCITWWLHEAFHGTEEHRAKSYLVGLVDKWYRCQALHVLAEYAIFEYLLWHDFLSFKQGFGNLPSPYAIVHVTGDECMGRYTTKVAFFIRISSSVLYSFTIRAQENKVVFTIRIFFDGIVKSVGIDESNIAMFLLEALQCSLVAVVIFDARIHGAFLVTLASTEITQLFTVLSHVDVVILEVLPFIQQPIVTRAQEGKSTEVQQNEYLLRNVAGLKLLRPKDY